MKEEEENVKTEPHAEPKMPEVKDAFEAAHEAFFSSGEKPHAGAPRTFTQTKTGGPAKK